MTNSFVLKVGLARLLLWSAGKERGNGGGKKAYIITAHNVPILWINRRL